MTEQEIEAIAQRIPNPNSTYRNRINQHGLFDLIRKLCFLVSPPLKMFNDDEPPQPRVPLVHVCIDCGGPATCQVKSNWYCDDCAP
jgi:hypothetical protein